MRLTKLTSGVAIVGLSAGLGLAALAAPAGAASTTITPYLPLSIASLLGSSHEIGVGQTDAGVWDNESCLIEVDEAHPGNNGKINNVVVAGHAGQLNVDYISESDLTTPVPTCAQVSIGLTATDAGAVATKPGGKLAVTTTSELQGGIEASSIVVIQVTYAAGQTIKQPTGSAIQGSDTGNTPGGGTVTYSLKPGSVKTKAVLTSSCADKVVVVDTDPTKTNPDGSPSASTWDGTTALTASQYMATMRECALDPTNIPGKPTTTSLTVTGHGTVDVRIQEADTASPQTWDTTAGKTCSLVKTTNTSGGPTFGSTAADVSRVMQCKGGYSTAIPFQLQVRPWDTTVTSDPNGLEHPATLDAGSFTF